MSVLKWKVISSSNFALFFIVMIHNSSVNFKVIPFPVWTKGSHQSSNFDTVKCSGENLPNFSCLFSNHWSLFLQNLHNSSVSRKITPLYFWRSNNIYFGHKEPIKKNKFLDFSSARVKFCEVHVNFKTTSQLPLNFCIILHCHDTYNSSVNLKLIHFILWTKASYQIPILILSSALVKICKIPHDIFQATSQFFFKFCITLQWHER